MVTLLEDCAGTRIGSGEVLGDRVRISIYKEPLTRSDWTTHDYNVHFSFGLHNDGERCRVHITVGEKDYEDLPNIAPILYKSAFPDRCFKPFTGDARTDLKKNYALILELNEGETVYLANTYVRASASIKNIFERLGDSSGMYRHVYGKSVDGRDLVAYFSDKECKKPAMLISSGFHPPEPDTLGTESILEWLSSQEGRMRRRLFNFVVVPLVNPDGFVRRTQGANANGINLYWYFAKELHGTCPEASYLWKFTKTIRPVGYIDFHSYTFQTKKESGPYVRPLFFYPSPVMREVASRFYRALMGRRRKPVFGFPTYAPHTLGSMLAKEYGTVTAAKYHLHLKNGVDEMREEAVWVLRQLVESFLKSGSTDFPKSREGRWFGLIAKLYCFITGCLRPQLGLIRRGKIKDVDFSRTGIRSP